MILYASRKHNVYTYIADVMAKHKSFILKRHSITIMCVVCGFVCVVSRLSKNYFCKCFLMRIAMSWRNWSIEAYKLVWLWRYSLCSENNIVRGFVSANDMWMQVLWWKCVSTIYYKLCIRKLVILYELRYPLNGILRSTFPNKVLQCIVNHSMLVPTALCIWETR